MAHLHLVNFNNKYNHKRPARVVIVSVIVLVGVIRHSILGGIHSSCCYFNKCGLGFYSNDLFETLELVQVHWLTHSHSSSSRVG